MSGKFFFFFSAISNYTFTYFLIPIFYQSQLDWASDDVHKIGAPFKIKFTIETPKETIMAFIQTNWGKNKIRWACINDQN